MIVKKYWDLEKETEAAFKCFDQMIKRENVTLSEAMQAIEDYNQSVILGPPIFFKTYLNHLEELNKLYREGHGIKEDWVTFPRQYRSTLTNTSD